MVDGNGQREARVSATCLWSQTYLWDPADFDITTAVCQSKTQCISGSFFLRDTVFFRHSLYKATTHSWTILEFENCELGRRSCSYRRGTLKYLQKAENGSQFNYFHTQVVTYRCIDGMKSKIDIEEIIEVNSTCQHDNSLTIPTWPKCVSSKF